MADESKVELADERFREALAAGQSQEELHKLYQNILHKEGLSTNPANKRTNNLRLAALGINRAPRAPAPAARVAGGRPRFKAPGKIVPATFDEEAGDLVSEGIEVIKIGIAVGAPKGVPTMLRPSAAAAAGEEVNLEEPAAAPARPPSTAAPIVRKKPTAAARPSAAAAAAPVEEEENEEDEFELPKGNEGATGGAGAGAAAAAAAPENEENEFVVNENAAAAGPQELVVAKSRRRIALAGVAAALDQRGREIEAMMEPVGVTKQSYIPSTRRAFREFIIQTYKAYALEKLPDIPDPDACTGLTRGATRGLLYQKFVRDFMQRPTPYRGVLVYHGLGSGKTCTSIALMDALFRTAPKKKIFVMTPAALNPNYRDEIMKCGPGIFRLASHWTFMKLNSYPTATPEYKAFIQLTDKLGIPKKILVEQNGAWIPDPTKASNLAALSPDQQMAVRTQINKVMNHRIRFIHYNSLKASFLREHWLCNQITNADPSKRYPNKFDGSTVIIDEVHNLIRTINNTNLEYFLNAEQEPREFYPNYVPKHCGEPGFKYPVTYILYRLLCNAVGCKIIALSATPIINFPQEVGVLANLLAGDVRLATFYIDGIAEDVKKRTLQFLQQHPSVDFAEVKPDPASGKSRVCITPVPSFVRKVINPKTGMLRGFIRTNDYGEYEGEIDRERNYKAWFESVKKALVENGVPVSGAAAAGPAGGAGAAAAPAVKFDACGRLPEIRSVFENYFIDTATVGLKEDNKAKLMARLSGLVSYYKGGRPEYMATVVKPPVAGAGAAAGGAGAADAPKDYEFVGNEKIEYVQMSPHQIAVYSSMRIPEIEREQKSGKKKKPAAAGAGNKLASYEDAMKQVSSTFMIFSRISCNFVFPEGMTRPTPSNPGEIRAMVGVPKAGDDVITGDLVVDKEAGGKAAMEGVAAEEAEGLMAAAPEEGVDEGVEEAGAAEELAAVQEAAAKRRAGPAGDYAAAIEGAIAHFRANPDLFSRDNLPKLSPKFQRIIDNMGKGNGTKGPVLVYSNFKTLEGTGLFGVALENQLGFVKLELVRNPDKTWSISPQTMAKGTGAGKLRYIAYTGDEWREARRVMLDIFNAKWSKLHPALKAQVDTLTGGAEHNQNGEIVKVFMITQSGAEGISLSNVRQVHLMEPYWNYVRLEQVKGRAIRICSHMDLPPAERTVEVFTYLSVLGDAPVDQTIQIHDDKLTSDQIIFRLMNTKKKLADDLQDVMQRSAVDCNLNHLEHGVLADYCFSTPFTASNAMDMNFHPKIEEDMK